MKMTVTIAAAVLALIGAVAASADSRAAYLLLLGDLPGGTVDSSAPPFQLPGK